jgi:hypothetical protein
VPAAWEALSHALRVLEEIDREPELHANTATPANPQAATDEDTDVYNGWTPAERAHWHQIAGSSRPIDAYHAYCHGGPAP